MWIINIDQTPVFSSMNPEKTIDVCEKNNQPSNLHKKISTKRCTVPVNIAAPGHKLPALVVLKCMRSGRIAKRDMTIYKKDQFYLPR